MSAEPNWVLYVSLKMILEEVKGRPFTVGNTNENIHFQDEDVFSSITFLVPYSRVI